MTAVEPPGTSALKDINPVQNLFHTNKAQPEWVGLDLVGSPPATLFITTLHRQDVT